MAREAGQLYNVARAVLNPTFKFLWRLDIDGLDRLPARGGAIFAPNHLSVLDHFVLGAALPRRITFVGKAEYMDSWKTKYIFPALGMIPIDRSGGSAADGALNAATRVLHQGEFFGIYPEGTRSRDGNLHRGHTGVARLSLQSGCPIFPVGLQGTLEVQPPDSSIPRPFRMMRVRIGSPIDTARYADRSTDRMALRQITDEVMYEIRGLSGQDYVDSYATKQPEGMPSAEPAQIHHDASPSDVGNDGGRRSSAEVLRVAAS